MKFRRLSQMAATFAATLLMLACPAAATTFQQIYTFNTSDGYWPQSGLVMDGLGNVYGTTSVGGAHGGGTIFELSPPAGGGTTWTFTDLYDFCSLASCADGQVSVAGLIIDTSGNLYGTTTAGGTGSSGTAYDGVVFQLKKPSGGGAWTYNVLHSFCTGTSCCTSTSCTDGYKSDAHLTYAGAASGTPYNGLSALYGTTERGGATDSGTVFQIGPSGTLGAWNYKVLYNFCPTTCVDGSGPGAGVTVDGSGNLYGTAGAGVNGAGVVYELVKGAGGAWTQTVLYAFCPSRTNDHCDGGESPEADIIFDASGNIVGTSDNGGTGQGLTGNGTIYSISGGVESVLYNFCSKTSCTDGTDASTGYGNVLNAGGRLFGMTKLGGLYNNGALYRLNPSGAYTVLYNFCPSSGCADGSLPLGGLIPDSSGNLYGTTMHGGNSLGLTGTGTIFKLTP